MQDSGLLMDVIDRIVCDSLNNWAKRSNAEIELALSLIFITGEIAPVRKILLHNMLPAYAFCNMNLQVYTASMADPKTVKLRSMVELMISSGVSHNKHLLVSIEYFENVVRYEKLFSIRSDLIPDVLVGFLFATLYCDLYRFNFLQQRHFFIGVVSRRPRPSSLFG